MQYFKTIFLSFTLLVIISCKSQEAQLVINKLKSDLPVKVLVSKQYKDSTLMTLMIPQEIEIHNMFKSDINLTRVSLSQSGADIANFRIGLLQVFKNNELQTTIDKTKFSIGQKIQFKLYASYFSFVTDVEKESILREGKFAQYLFKDKRKVFDLNTLSNTPEFLLKKVKDMNKGFIHLTFYSSKSRKYFSENIPVEF
ncbi:hypothetical protein ACSTS3_04655 [Aquimarina muelleri]|uniref:hypothetical protein n=1 Tax=Aquimarina muelleri TaxID=279356 RepID=UPI003F68415B